jgi:hypothetical protein
VSNFALADYRICAQKPYVDPRHQPFPSSGYCASKTLNYPFFAYVTSADGNIDYLRSPYYSRDRVKFRALLEHNDALFRSSTFGYTIVAHEAPSEMLICP